MFAHTCTRSTPANAFALEIQGLHQELLKRTGILATCLVMRNHSRVAVNRLANRLDAGVTAYDRRYPTRPEKTDSNNKSKSELNLAAEFPSKTRGVVDCTTLFSPNFQLSKQ
jgi:hypothetical protein